MKTESQYDPMSLSLRVKERVEKRARGTLTGDPASTPNMPPPKQKETGGLQDAENSISDEFLNLLFTPPADLPPTLPRQAQNKSNNFDSLGTMRNSLPLKLQEEKIPELQNSKQAFSFKINNLPEGEVKVSGSYIGGKLKLALRLANKLSVQQQDVLVKMLKAQLSNELGVPLEVEIDRSVE